MRLFSSMLLFQVNTNPQLLKEQSGLQYEHSQGIFSRRLNTPATHDIDQNRDQRTELQFSRLAERLKTLVL
jgi:hypothetical protein